MRIADRNFTGEYRGSTPKAFQWQQGFQTAMPMGQHEFVVHNRLN
jgi:hypothetical protein